MLDHVRIVAGIAREHRDAAGVLETGPVARLDDVAVVDLEGDDRNAILVVHDTVAETGHSRPSAQLLIDNVRTLAKALS
jgi:hypothetical protein